MFGSSLKSKFFIFVLIAGIFFTFGTCEAPMGLGDSIDWEAPVLTIDPVPSPMYVRLGTSLSGTVTDNKSVSNVIMRDAVTGNTLFDAAINGNRWKIDLSFSEEQNGEKITAEIVAYDKAKNSGERSIVTVILMIDIKPPVISDVMITRTPTKIAFLETYDSLKSLEVSDLNGELSTNVDKYQNGWFYIDGKVSEEETRIDIVSLNIYDAREPDISLVSLSRQEGSSEFSPRWLVKEEDIIEAGDDLFKAGNAVFKNYKTNYYDNNERYYYRVAVTAVDKSENEIVFTEDKGFFCMWKKGDEPEGIFDPSMGTVVTRGTPLPVEFYDDDQLNWAYSALFTLDQWNGGKHVADGVSISGGNDEEKLVWLTERLLSGQPLYNWRYDKYKSEISESSLITEIIKGASVSDKLIYVPTGSQELDYGDFVLISLAGDKKIEPHTAAGPEITNTNIWKGRAWKVQVIDDNAPVIVFDTVVTTESGYDYNQHLGSAKNELIVLARTGDSPEENTFPKLTEGRFFELNGYTLRENTSGLNTVGILRMAWIPYGMPGGPDAYITRVQEALSAENYPNSFSGLAGVQHWEFNENFSAGGGGDKQFVTGTNQEVNGSPFKKQVFRKRFDVLGDVDDTKPEYRNFTYNGKLENDTKLFVLCAIDNTGRPVYKQMRFLGMNNAPTLAVYDISTKSVTLPLSPPLPDIYEDNPNGDFTEAYAEKLKIYNENPEVYNALRAVSMPSGTLDLAENDATIPFQTYTRGTELKYWIMAERSGDLAVADIKMEDITNERGAITMGSEFNETDRAISFVESFPDVTSRVFRFTATDTLGNDAVIQRTVAITNAAFLRDITTTAQNGSYGIGQKITLQANFTSQIRIETGIDGRKPELNVRYQVEGETGYYKIASIPCNENPSDKVLTLTFDFIVEEGFTGILETMYESNDMTGNSSHVGPINTDMSRPIRLLNGARIMDVSRNEPAFVPGYIVGSSVSSSWTTELGSLQSRKGNIQLDGKRPSIDGLTISGKAADSNNYYFKAGEIINFTFTADKAIRAEGTPKLNYVITDLNGNTELYKSIASDTTFVYQRPQGNNGMVFTLNTNDIPDFSGDYGKLHSVSIASGSGAGKIVDEVGNEVVIDTVNMTHAAGDVFIKTSTPPKPGTTVGGSNTNYYNYSPALDISNPSTSLEPWPVTKQYSLNGGTTWITYPNAQSENPAWTKIDVNDGKLKILNGEWNLSTRYVDKAGNQGTPFDLAVHVNQNFPRLESVSAAEPAGTYKAGGSLTFTLNFAEAVSEGSVSITIKDRSNLTDAQELTATISENTDSIDFDWTIPSGKQMNNGLYIAEIDLTGLRDRFGNFGGKSSVSANYTTINMPNYTVNNLPSGIIVDSTLPTVTARTPAMNAVSEDNKTITLTFSENVMAGSGTITVRPKADFAIPPVFEDTGYYLGTDGVRYTSSGANRTYISSFYDVYQALDSINQGYLTRGNSMSDLTLNARTGQSAGPYKKMTQGLTAGRGYSGNYSQEVTDNTLNSGEAPNISGDNYMVPDTATKWVLDYQYGINQNIAAVNNIRAALTAAKFRWQEIDAGSAVITGGNKVTITLNEPLLKGLDWEVYYPEGAFTDMAGNPAAAQGNIAADPKNWTTDYYFKSSGVQAPVIRVNRRSFDARNSNWASNTNRTYEVPPDTTGWNANTINVTDNNGWGITDFNTVHYRVESETPDAVISAKVYQGVANNQGAVTAAWTGDVRTNNLNNITTNLTNRAWDLNNNDNGSRGEWVMPNLVRRSTGNDAAAYTVDAKNGTERRTFKGTLRMFRSYNKDLRTTEIDGAGTGGADHFNDDYGQGYISFGALEASKSYVIGTATADRNPNGGSVSRQGYEGVFRTVIALNFDNPADEYNFMVVEGSNIKNGMPSIAGFPVRDAEEKGDNRFVKAFYRDGEDGDERYWVSTEIVCEWYFLYWNTGGHLYANGEVNNYLTVGYGDLTYAYNLTR